MDSKEELQVSSLTLSGARLKGRVLAVEKTRETAVREGETWDKCIFTVEITRFSRRTPEGVVPPELRGKRVKLVRHCLYDWHYRLGTEKTLTPEETETLLQGKQASSIFW